MSLTAIFLREPDTYLFVAVKEIGAADHRKLLNPCFGHFKLELKPVIIESGTIFDLKSQTHLNLTSIFSYLLF